MTAKANANYTPEMTAVLVERYQGGESVESLAAAFGKSIRSIVAKLSREGHYKAQERTTKNGDAIIKKESLADQIGMLVGLTEADTDSLTKANKVALAKILAVIKDAKISTATDVS